MKKEDVFRGSKYLKAEDLRGQSHTVHITTVMMEEIGQDAKEAKAVCYFVGKDKGLVLNQINWSTIEAMYGDDSDNWSGKMITIFPTETPFQGKIVPCIRVQPGQSQEVAKAAAFVEQSQSQAPAQPGQTQAPAQSPATAQSPPPSDPDDCPF